MKRIRTCILYPLSLSLALLLSSCEYYYTDGLFSGLWQVVSIEDRDNGAKEFPEGSAYYAFQRHMIQLSYFSEDKVVGDEPVYYVSYFTREDDSLHVEPFRVNREEHKLAPLEELRRFGIYDGHTSFLIDEQGDKCMTLTSEEAVVTLRRH